MQNENTHDSVFPKRDPLALRFSDEQDARLQEWFEAGKPGEPHEWLGISEENYTATRAAMVERHRQFLRTPQMQMWFAIMWASRFAKQMRMDDDGAPPLPDGYKTTPDFRNIHLRPDYVARRLG